MSRETSVNCLLLAVLAGACAAPAKGPEDTLREAWALARDEFFDPGMNGVDWEAALARYAPAASRADTREELSAVVNSMVGELGASHTGHYHAGDPRYYELIDIFDFGSFHERIREVVGEGEVRYTTIGVQTKTIDGETFVYDARDGLPGERAGLRAGDRLISIGGEPYDDGAVLELPPGTPVTLRVQRVRDGPTFEVDVTPERRNPGDVFLASMRDSARVLERDGVRVGYVRVRNFAGVEYHELLDDLVLRGELARADALVLDIRGAWGGANAEDLNLFNPRVPVLSAIHRDGRVVTHESQWRKPVVLLVDETARSGKEVLAYGFRKFDLGPVVGATTAGAVVGGRPFLLGDGSLLFLAVQDARVDGERLEGVGVAPDIPVPRSLAYSAGVDPQYETALDTAASLVTRRD